LKTEKLSRTKVHTVYKLNGVRVPGVTTILGVLAKEALIHWAWDLGTKGIDYRKYRDVLADIGTLTHILVQCEFTGEKPDTSSFSKEQIDKAENCLISFYEWQKGHKIKPLLTEKALVSRLGFGGTIDCLAMVDGAKTLLDFKTGKAIYDEYFYQLAAYNKLLQENGHPDVQNVRILRIGRDESEGFEERLIPVANLKAHWRIFASCLVIYKCRKITKNGGKK